MPTEKEQAKRAEEHKAGRRLSINLIGAGRLGTALATALERRGYRIETVLARRLAHARRASQSLQSQPRALSSAHLQALPDSDILLITTPDDAIGETARKLAQEALGQRTQQGRVALHASGALSSDVLAPLKELGFHTGSMHPLVSISEPSQGAESLRGAFYCVEGDAKAARMARRLVRSLGGRSFSIHSEHKALYHAAAVMASGHVAALFDLSMEMLMRCGLTEQRARLVLTPLLSSMTENLSALGPRRALTGTFARADTATVRRHLEALRRLKETTALDVYRLLGERSLRLAAKRGADKAALALIREMLEEDSEADGSAK